jgi:hypothetical protein
MTNNIELIKRRGRIILIICTIIESIFYFDIANIYGCAVLLYAWWLFEKFVFSKENFQKFFLPTVAITGYIVMYYFLPIIVTLIERKPLTFKFEVPYRLWTNQIINISVIILAYGLSRKYYSSNNFLSNLWIRFGLFKIPTERQIWVLGFIGILALLYNVITQKTDAEDFDVMQTNVTGGFYLTVINTIQNLVIVPLCLFFSKYYRGEEKSYNKTRLFLYLALVGALGIATTRRGLIFYPILSLTLVYFFGAIINNKKIISGRKLIIISVISLLVSGPIMDIAAAMSLNRHNINGTSTLKEVIKLYNDKEKLHKMYQYLSVYADKDNANNSVGWSEYYVDNIFLDRFCNLRVQDASLYYADQLGYNNEYMHQFAKDFVILRIPTFFTNMLGEVKVIRTSPADVFVDQYFHIPNFIGQKVGGDIGIGLYWLGYLYYPFALLIYFINFLFWGTLVSRINNNPIIPVVILCAISQYFMFFVNSTGIFKSISLLMRDGFQYIIIYCILFFIVRKLIK